MESHFTDDTVGGYRVVVGVFVHVPSRLKVERTILVYDISHAMHDGQAMFATRLVGNNIANLYVGASNGRHKHKRARWNGGGHTAAHHCKESKPKMGSYEHEKCQRDNDHH